MFPSETGKRLAKKKFVHVNDARSSGSRVMEFNHAGVDFASSPAGM
jgi:hypothetical protein